MAASHVRELFRGRAPALLVLLVLFMSVPLVPDAMVDGRRVSGVALLPPLIAIASVVITRRLLTSLGLGVLAGALLHHGPVMGLPLGVRDYAIRNLFDATHLYIIGFTLALLGMVQVTGRSGGAVGIVASVATWVRGTRSTAVGTFVMGLLIFFDDYANCMLVGPTMRPLADRHRMSREKLAYLIDSTAAPVAGLVLISTWVGYETGLLDDAAKALKLSENGYSLLFSALPFRFYCVLTLVFVLANAVMGRDFGPMFRAERRAARLGKLVADDASPMGDDTNASGPPDGAPLRWINAALPVGVVVLGTLGGLVVDGGGLPALRSAPGEALSFGFWQRTLGAAENNVQVLFWAALSGAVIALILPLAQRILPARDAVTAFARGVRTGLLAALVLLLAWALAAVCKDLGTGPVLVAALGDRLPAFVTPTATFFLAAAIAFSTGTSWGTMAILIPTAVPLAHATGNELVLLLTIASVLDGAIFGDHCSPISDTTLMSSIAAGSDHLHHVATQLPYATTVMAAAVLGGYLPVALGIPPLFGVTGAALSLVVILRIFGRSPRADGGPTDAPEPAPTTSP